MDKQLMDLIESNQKLVKAVASSNTQSLTTQSTGIFGVPGLDPNVISAYVAPLESIGNVLPILPTQDSNPLYPSFTGFTGEDGVQPAEVCDDAPSTDMKSCILTSQFGVTRFDTKTIEAQEVLKKANRGVFTDLQLAGQILGVGNVAPGSLDGSQVVNMVEMAAMVSAAALAEQKLVKEFWQGNVNNTNEFPGLDVQIVTGQKDALTGTLCPSLDPDVKDFNYQEVGSSTNDIAEYLEMVEYYLKSNDMASGLNVNRVLVMRPQLWQRLTQVWPVKYNTLPQGLWGTDNGQRLMIDGTDMTRQRDVMRNAKVITVNGTDYPVIPDVGIFEQNSTNDANLAAGQFASSIYFLPLTANGIPVLFREYLDYNLFGSEIFRMDKQDFWTTDNGVYSWAIEKNKWCHKFALKTEQRIVLRAPQLAGRIDNVMYSPLQHLRDADFDSPYHVNGGVSTRSATSYQAVWK